MDKDLKTQRWKAGRLSQIELSKLSGVSRFRISLAETGLTELRDKELYAIEAALADEVRRRAKEFDVRLGNRR